MTKKCKHILCFQTKFSIHDLWPQESNDVKDILLPSITYDWNAARMCQKIHKASHNAEKRIQGRQTGIFAKPHDDVIRWKHFPRYWPLCGEFTDPRWIPRTRASDTELWCFLWNAPCKRLSKQSLGWWFETPSSSLWGHCKASVDFHNVPWRQMTSLVTSLLWLQILRV